MHITQNLCLQENKISSFGFKDSHYKHNTLSERAETVAYHYRSRLKSGIRVKTPLFHRHAPRYGSRFGASPDGRSRRRQMGQVGIRPGSGIKEELLLTLLISQRLSLFWESAKSQTIIVENPVAIPNAPFC